MGCLLPTGSLQALAIVALLIGGSPVAVASTQGAPAGIGVGRFSEPLVRCKVSAFGAQRQWQNCGVLRLEQNLEGLLSVRFSLGNSGGRFGDQELVFAGTLNPPSHPMACQDDGRCTPRFPVQLRVNAMASGRYDRRGVATGLPQAWLVQGQCRIEALGASCEAVDREGARWRAEGFFRGGVRPDRKASTVDNRQQSARVSSF